MCINLRVSVGSHSTGLRWLFMNSGVIVLALPISIVGGAFSEAYDAEKKAANGEDSEDISIQELRNEFHDLRSDLGELKKAMRRQQNTLNEIRKGVLSSST